MAEEYRTPAIGTPVRTPQGEGIMAGVTGSRYAVDMPDGRTLGFDPLSIWKVEA